MEFMTCIDEFDDLIHRAKPIPLTDEVRVPAAEAHSLVERLRTNCPPEVRSRPDSETVRLIDRLDRQIADAKPVPLTNQVRLPKEELYDTLDLLRATFPEEIRASREEPGRAGAPLQPISVEEASRDLAGLVERVRYGGEAFVIEVAGVPMAQLRPPA